MARAMCEPELLVDIGRRFLEIDVEPRERTEVVIDGDRSATEEHVQPQNAGQASMRRRIVRRELDCAPQKCDGFLVLQAVGKIGGAHA